MPSNFKSHSVNDMLIFSKLPIVEGIVPDNSGIDANPNESKLVSEPKARGIVPVICGRFPSQNRLSRGRLPKEDGIVEVK